MPRANDFRWRLLNEYVISCVSVLNVMCSFPSALVSRLVMFFKLNSALH